MPGKRSFLDTNIFVYSFDQSQPTKRKRAQDLIASALADRNGIISYQVVQEFLNVATSKFKRPLSTQDARSYLDRVLNPLCEVYPDSVFFATALSLREESGYAFYDSLILAAALAGGCDRLLTEDLHDGQTVRGVLIQNPFPKRRQSR
ncbi:MAG: PIN domain-containing protein [Spirochaetales bacterium]|nr:PIN domain-containing protein [Leptospiraceae bacterium]MCP5482398.1 PIN domain-containing protein [Spirochaetales bacterium]MCP5484163.1 PIN domain-containing protein [Spirochaetales bacterium]